MGAYIKLGDTYGRTLNVVDFDNEYFKANFDKSTYTNFYKVLGGQWKYNLAKEDFVKNGMSLKEEINKLNLVKEQKDKIIEYLENELRNVINISLGTTIKIDIQIDKLFEKDIDELAEKIYKFIMQFKEKVEDKKK